MSQKHFLPLVFCTLASLIFGLATVAEAAVPMTSAKVTRIENKATIGTIRSGQIQDERPAVVSDVITSSSVFQTSSSGRAELEFSNKSLIRLGPNSVFSFDSSSRTVSLEKGNMLFYLPPGQGGVKIKTAAATAALTGTVVAVTESGIAVLEGSFTLTYTVGGVTKSLTLTAGEGNNNAATFDPTTGEYVPTHMDPASPTSITAALAATSTNLVSFAALPNNAEVKIAAGTPSLVDAIAEEAASLNAAALKNGGSSGSDAVQDVLNTLTPLGALFPTASGGSAAAGVVTTRVAADGTIEVLDASGNKIGNFAQ